MLEHNPNYSARFRALGLAYLNGAPASFGDTFGGMLDEVAFEYRFFLAHFDQGYRADLCSWDWKRKSKELAAGATASTRVSAQRGWQPTGVTVVEGQRYDFVASGNWQTTKDGKEVSANGASDRAGQLEATILHDFSLSRPMPLGSQGSFEATSGGQLYIRCRDKWNELADNRGTVSVRFKRVSEKTATTNAGGAASD